MKQTHSYSASHYVSDNGFPLTWMCRCCLTGGAESTRKEEAEEYHLRNKTQTGKIIGRPAGHQAYKGQSAMRYQQPQQQEQ